MLKHRGPGKSMAWIAGLIASLSATVHAEDQKVVKGSAPPVVRERMDALERLVESRNEESLTYFLAEQVSPAAQEAKGKDAWLTDLKEIRRRCAEFGTINVAPRGEWAFLVQFGRPSGKTAVEVELEPTSPHQFKKLQLGPPEKESAPLERADTIPPLSWDNLGERLKAEEANGFAGTVLVVKHGKIVLHEAYGLADRDRKTPNRPDTIFAIGSTPIDFTKVAVLKLEDIGKLNGSDPIAKFLPSVPPDKTVITIDHLMTGRSGLRNFHGRTTDADLDNSWLDRDTAVKRILEDELLFPPGTDRAHSHSAFGLLAAIVEVVSGEPIGTFFKQHLFEQAGMNRTSLYEDINAPQAEIAIGYGGSAFSAVNSPNHWGKTSWLVMGSGGMVSTTRDLYQFNQALREGKILSVKAVGKYFMPGGGLLVGASDNGFMAGNTEGPDSVMFLCSNVIGRERTERLIQDLAELVNGGR